MMIMIDIFIIFYTYFLLLLCANYPSMPRAVKNFTWTLLGKETCGHDDSPKQPNRFN